MLANGAVTNQHNDYFMFEVEMVIGVPVNALLEKSILSIPFLHVYIHFASNVFWHWKFQSTHMEGLSVLAFLSLVQIYTRVAGNNMCFWRAP